MKIANYLFAIEEVMATRKMLHPYTMQPSAYLSMQNGCF